MSNVKPEEYTVNIQSVMVDGMHFYEARVSELADIHEYADTPQEAYALALDTIETAAEMYAEQGRALPLPITAREVDDFSGRVTLRMAKSLHALVTTAADAEGVSINHYMNTVLAYHIGTRLDKSASTTCREDVFALIDDSREIVNEDHGWQSADRIPLRVLS